MPRSITKRIRKSIAIEHLGISRDTFDRVWAAVFTDTRPPSLRGAPHVRYVLEDELRLAVEEGAEAVLAYRDRLGRV